MVYSRTRPFRFFVGCHEFIRRQYDLGSSDAIRSTTSAFGAVRAELGRLDHEMVSSHWRKLSLHFHHWSIQKEYGRSDGRHGLGEHVDEQFRSNEYHDARSCGNYRWIRELSEETGSRTAAERRGWAGIELPSSIDTVRVFQIPTDHRMNRNERSELLSSDVRFIGRLRFVLLSDSPTERSPSRFDSQQLRAGFLVAVAYSSAIGGIVTLVGTPSNIFAKGFMEE